MSFFQKPLPCHGTAYFQKKPAGVVCLFYILICFQENTAFITVSSVMTAAEHRDGFLDQHGSDGSHNIKLRIGGPPGRDQIGAYTHMDQCHPHTDDGDKDQIDYDVAQQQIQEGSFLRAAYAP